MKRERGIARCGLACCLCSENTACAGCDAGCAGNGWCENRRCSLEKGLAACYMCGEPCQKGLLGKIKPYAFTRFARQRGVEALLDCLERNERSGVVYHRAGILGDYDDFTDVDALVLFIETGTRQAPQERPAGRPAEEQTERTP